MGIVQDLLDRQQDLATGRSAWEATWRVLADYALPTQPRTSDSVAGHPSRPSYDRFVNRGPVSVDRGRRLYDSTSVWSIDRLTAGMESLVSPPSEMWHELTPDDVLQNGEPGEEETAWNERLRDYLFSTRYDPRSGFALHNQKALRSVAALGTSVMFVEEARTTDRSDIRSIPIRYRTLPLSENFLAVDAYDVVDTNFRVFPLMARQALAMFKGRGGRVHEAVEKAAESETDKDRAFDFLHAVFPRAERGSRRGTNRDSAYVSVYLDIENKFLISESGFFDFPYIVQWWQQQEGSAYGESPVMLALADIVMLQQMAKTTLRASQQMLDPPLGLPAKGIMNRPDLNPRALNYGAVDKGGNLLVRPIVTAQNLPFAEQIMAVKREQSKESLYINLFQILIQNPAMTATEALIRANEKGELLGPAGAKIQDGYSRMVDREIGILSRLGAFAEGSFLEPPEALQGRSIGPRFTSPLDRLRRSAELVAADRTVERAVQAAASGRPEALDLIDIDEYVRLAREIEGAPSRILLDRETVEEIRTRRLELEQEQAAIETARAAGEAGNAALPALAEAQELVDGLSPEEVEALGAE